MEVRRQPDNLYQQEKTNGSGGEKADQLNRPQAAISVLSSNSLFEVGKPDSGVNVRIRTRWNSVRQDLEAAAVQLEQLIIDGQRVNAEEVTKKGYTSRPADVYYLYNWGVPTHGEHIIEAKLKDIKSGRRYTYASHYPGLTTHIAESRAAAFPMC